MPNDVTSPDQSQFGSITPKDMWLKLRAFVYPTQPAHQKSDQLQTDAWDAAIDSMGQIFTGLTLASC